MNIRVTFTMYYENKDGSRSSSPMVNLSAIVVADSYEQAGKDALSHSAHPNLVVITGFQKLAEPVIVNGVRYE